jgi:hypothetical protein
MAIAVIGGLMASNFFTLLVVPVVFTLIHDLQTSFREFSKKPVTENSSFTASRFGRRKQHWDQEAEWTNR